MEEDGMTAGREERCTEEKHLAREDEE